MSFEAYAASENTGKEKSNIEQYKAMNEFVVETAQLQEGETLIGIVAGIVDLGTQKQPDSEMPYAGTEQDEADEIAKNSNTYFKDGYDYAAKKNVRMKCWPNKPVQCVALAIDFPDIIIDKGQFFGESKPLPLRIWMGGQFYTQEHGMVIGRPIPLKVNKKLGDWSFDVKHQLYKMAVDSKLVKTGQPFAPKRIDELLGKAFQFKAQVFMKPGKDGKEYYTEYIKYVGGLGRGQSSPDYELEPFMIQFNAKNSEEKMKELRWHVINTIKQASNYPGSELEAQLDEIAESKGSSSDVKPKEEKPKAVITPSKSIASKPKAKVVPVDDLDDDSDLPF